jgi:hypothetical protein
LTLTSTFFLATLPDEQQDWVATWVLQAALVSVLQAALAFVEHVAFSPACNDAVVAKAAIVRQTRSLFMLSLTGVGRKYSRRPCLRKFDFKDNQPYAFAQDGPA